MTSVKEIFTRVIIIIGLLLLISILGKTANAATTLDIDLGVPSGEAIFTLTNMLPGDIESRDVTASNSGDEPGDLSVISIKDDSSTHPPFLEDLLTIIIYEDGSPIYGPVSVQQFFDDSGESLDGLYLGQVSPGGAVTYTFEVTFPESAGNEYQNKFVVFDLKFVTPLAPPIELPEECKDLEGIVTKKIEGDEHSNFIWGTHESELIMVYGKNDVVFGNGGDDCIFGGEGNDRLYGGTGNDIIVGGPGKDKIYGQTGEDILWGNEGNDKIDGGSDSDLIYGGVGDDQLDGQSENDIVYGGEGKDNIKGGGGKDHLYGEDSDDKIYGESQNDFLDGGADFDRLNGGGHIDTCIAGEILTQCEL